MSFIALQLQAAVALARADVAEHGFALPRARFVRAGTAPAFVLHPDTGRPPNMTPEQADDWFCAQLTGGRARIATTIAEHGPRDLPTAARVVLAFMDVMPREMQSPDTTIGFHAELWDPHERKLLARAVLAYTVNDSGLPELGRTELQAPASATEPTPTLN